MKEVLLKNPDGVVLRLSHRNGKVQINWQWQLKRFEVEASTVAEAIHEAIQALEALRFRGLI